MSASWQQESAVNWSDFHKKWAEHSLTLGTPNFRHFKLWCTLVTWIQQFTEFVFDKTDFIVPCFCQIIQPGFQ